MGIDRLCRRVRPRDVRIELNEAHATNVHLHVLDVARELRHITERDAGREQREAAGRDVGDGFVAYQPEMASAWHAKPSVHLIDAVAAKRRALAVDLADELVRDCRRSRLAG